MLETMSLNKMKDIEWVMEDGKIVRRYYENNEKSLFRIVRTDGLVMLVDFWAIFGSQVFFNKYTRSQIDVEKYGKNVDVAQLVEQ